MARKKVKLEWIVNDSARKATFKKRKKGLMKKVSELSTLCDVKACLIVYGAGEPHADVWPSMPEAMRVLARLKRLPEMEQSKKMMNQEALMRQRIRKLQEQLQRQDKENRELETTLLMQQCLDGRRSLRDVPIEDVTALAWMTEMKMGKVRERMAAAAAAAATTTTTIRAGDAKEGASSPSAPAIKAADAREGGYSSSAAAKGKTAVVGLVAEEMPRHDWFAEAMELGDLVIGSRNDEVVVQGNSDSKSPWLNAFYPLN